MFKQLSYYWGFDYSQWDHEYSKGWAIKLGRKVRGQARLEIAWVIHKKEYRGW